MAAAQFGDPLSRVDSNSFGKGGRDGIGEDGCCRGIGPGQQGPPGLGARAITAITTPPKLIYKIEPEFSEEARKAKFQGTVILSIEVDESGRATNLRVISSPGLGLDQKAIEAVAQWRFRPASQGGKPVASSARVEVNFHLL
jgi:periplasmic protein TonB